ncbi:MAG: BufA2 family periplasmic bufferin-type metallophore [Ostreibacterium sp.]
MLKQNKTNIILALGAAALITTAVVTTVSAKEKLGECHGINSCKGQSSCASANNDCAGQNTCKGKGWVKTDRKTCDAKAGKFTDKK